MTSLERFGIPSVAIVAKGFKPIFQAEQRRMGLENLQAVFFEHPFTEMDPRDVSTQVAQRFNEFTAALTALKDMPADAQEVTDATGRVRIEGKDFHDSMYRLNRYFIEQGWSDGFPIVPPTEETVNRMLKGTSRQRREVVLKMEPDNGIATVEKIAINCVMAGCEPEHLPVVIAAIEAMHEPEFGVTVVAQSTGPHAPLLLVNGPVVEQLGLNYGMCTLGPGKYSWANTAIGRAVRLAMMNIGHCYPRFRDMDTIGSPNKYSFCAAENEDENPWQPFHVEKGFSRDTSCVTVFPCASFIDVSDLESSTAEQCLMSFAGTADSVGWRGCRSWIGDLLGLEAKIMLMIAPDHARLISGGGFSKDDIRTFMFERCRRPWGHIKHLIQPDLVHPDNRKLLDSSDDDLIPFVKDPGYFDVVVVGGHAGKSAVCLQIGSPVIKEMSP